ncbi:TPA: hypothetical protein ACX6NV_002031 [Photobacterium damselae]
MTSKQRCSLRRKLRKQGKSEEEIQTIINNTPTAQQRETTTRVRNANDRLKIKARKAGKR